MQPSQLRRVFIFALAAATVAALAGGNVEASAHTNAAARCPLTPQVVTAAVGRPLVAEVSSVTPSWESTALNSHPVLVIWRQVAGQWQHVAITSSYLHQPKDGWRKVSTTTRPVTAGRYRIKFAFVILASSMRRLEPGCGGGGSSGSFATSPDQFGGYYYFVNIYRTIR